MAKSSKQLLLLAAAVAGLASAHSFIDSGKVTENEAKQSLLDELDGNFVNKDSRWAELRKALSTTFEALPKNSNGFLDHQAVRYALHRFFVQRYGWYIKGLEPTGENWHHEAPPDKPELAKLKEWVPSFLQNLLEDRLHHKGLDLDGLVALAASLEDLVSHEAEERLKTAYHIHDLDVSDFISREQAEDLARTWYVGFLLAGNFSAKSLDEVHAKKAVFARRYSDWKDADAWLHEVEEEHYASKDMSKAPTFTDNLRLVRKIGEQYFHFNDKECKALKSTLTDMEGGKKAGRVRLSTFYQKSLYSHWRFTEKADYLRKLGALDESDPQQPQVIMTNYLTARPNCLEASGLYALCCRNECEDLMGQLEGELKSSEAEPQQIAELVASMASDTVSAPRDLGSPLLSRLNDVASANGGKVPIHGRLFAQWMHHAYPRECPYPHESGTTLPQTPDEWMKETGQSDSSASAEEMRRQVESDVCAIDENGKPKGGAGCDEAADLPWTSSEELLVTGAQVEKKVETAEKEETVAEEVASSLDQKQGLDVIFAAAVAITLAFALIYDYWRASVVSRHSKGEVLYLNSVSSRDLAGRFSGCQKALAVWGLASLAWAMDLLDTSIFSCSMCGGLVVLGARRFSEQFQGMLSSKDKLGKI